VQWYALPERQGACGMPEIVETKVCREVSLRKQPL
jgi:hypothetical protein